MCTYHIETLKTKPGIYAYMDELISNCGLKNKSTKRNQRKTQNMSFGFFFVLFFICFVFQSTHIDTNSSSMHRFRQHTGKVCTR